MNYSITATRLRESMNKKGLNAATLEQLSGVGKSSISHYYNGTHKPSNTTAEALAKVLNVNPLWLMGFDVPEDRTIFLYSKLTDEDKLKVKGYIDALLMDSKYIKTQLENHQVG